MSVKLGFTDSNGKDYSPSGMNNRFNTFEDLETDLKGWTAGPADMVYVAQLGAVKRKYKCNADGVWERVLHPRGTKKKKETPSESAEVKQSPVVPCSIDDFYSVPAKTKLPDGWLHTAQCNWDSWLTQSQVDKATCSRSLPQGWITVKSVTTDTLAECTGKWMLVKDGKLVSKVEVTKV